ncbi:MAG: HD domain-containing protein [Spirochaetales bacterium]|nr:HD domain-containing protein [Spirochaetales bacterium]
MKPQEDMLAAGNVISSLTAIMDVVNSFLVGHQKRVAELASALAAEMNLPPDLREGLRIAGLLHDIGEIAVPISILAKHGKLNADESGLVKAHPQTGYAILKTLGFSQPVAEIVLQHHERLDGSGYPHRLKADAILPQARILAVAEVVVAMTSQAMYRTAPGVDAAVAEITRNKGTLYDPGVVGACLTLCRKKGFRFQ